MEIPNFLKSTYNMLLTTFPNGIEEDDYWCVLYLLYDYMADENLALVMSFLTNKPIEMIVNDIYKAYQMAFDSILLNEIMMRLDKHGFEEWKTLD